MPEHLHDNYGPEARFAVEAEAALPTIRWDEEVARGLELGLPGADSIVDKRIPTFSRGELPHFAGINTFLKAPYVEDVRRCGEYDVAVLGAPFDGGTTYRSGTRFGPQGIRKYCSQQTILVTRFGPKREPTMFPNKRIMSRMFERLMVLMWGRRRRR